MNADSQFSLPDNIDMEKTPEILRGIYTPENLRAMIKKFGLTRNEFAKMFGVAKRALDNWCLPFDSKGHCDMPAPKWFEIVKKSLDNT
jgi:hypothetical protein